MLCTSVTSIIRILDRRVHPVFAPCVTVMLSLAFCGCTHERYKIETVIGSDGLIDRAICQSPSTLPGNVGNDPAWTGKRSVGRPEQGTLIRSMKALKRKKGEPASANGAMEEHTSLWGTFDRVSDIPGHFVLEAEGLDRKGTLQREYRRHDLGLVIEHSWRETLTDVVELDDRRRARDQLVKTGIDVAFGSLRQRFGNTYCFDGLERWARTNVASLVADLLDFDLQVAIAGDKVADEVAQTKIISLLARHGLRMADDKGQLLKTIPKDGDTRFVLPFLRSLLRKEVTTSSGQSISGEHIDEILIWLQLMQPAEEPDRAPTGEEEPPTPLEAAYQEVVKRQFGSEEKYKALTSRLGTRIWGLYRPPIPLQIFGTQRHFDVSLRLPGRIVETNGKLSGGDSVVWRFSASEAFPSGYVMRCRSLEVRGGSEVLLKRLDPSKRPSVLLDLVETVHDSKDPLVKVLQQCARTKSWSPLESYRKGLDTRKQAEERKRLVGLYRLLQLPLTGSADAGT